MKNIVIGILLLTAVGLTLYEYVYKKSELSKAEKVEEVEEVREAESEGPVKIDFFKKDKTEEKAREKETTSTETEYKAEFEVIVEGFGKNPTLVNMQEAYVFQVSSSDYNQADLSVTTTKGELTKVSDGKYEAKVTEPGKFLIGVTATKSDGSTKSLGSHQMTIKRVFDPNDPRNFLPASKR